MLEFSTIFKFYPGNFGYKLSALGPGQEVALDLVGKIGLQPSNMASNLGKKLLLVAVGAVASAALLVGTYEGYKCIQYDRGNQRAIKAENGTAALPFHPITKR